MSCSNCGSTSPCGCSQQINTAVGRTCITGCGCGNPNCCGTCGCNNVLPASPLPFYACAPACPENHKQTIINQQFYYDIAAQNTWNIPACGETAILYVPGLKSIAIGAYIWSSEFGYYEVTAFDASSQAITIINHCNTDNAAPGTNVPACSKFTVTDPPADNSSTTDSCVAIDFTAPAVGVCIPITLTNLDSIQVGDLIQIGDGRYRVQSIDSIEVITICNDGLGLIAGTAVIAIDDAGNYQYCITVVASCCSAIAEDIVIINEEIVTINEEIDTFKATLLNVASTPVSGILTGLEVITSNNSLISIVNSSASRTMLVTISVIARGAMESDSDGIFELLATLQQDVDGGGFTTVASQQVRIETATNVVIYPLQLVYSATISVAPGVTTDITYNIVLTNEDTIVSMTYTDLHVRTTALGVAI